MTAPTPAKVQELTGTTRVIVSFGGMDGGFELTAQLRLDIMDRYGRRRIFRDPAGKFLSMQSDESFCYLDAVTLKNAEGTTYNQVMIEKTDITGYKSKRAVDINKMANPYWNTYYPAAVANAAVMVFQITNPWLNSEYCLEEFGWFIAQSVRNIERGQPLSCIFIVFQEAEEGFRGLLDQLRVGVATKVISNCLVGTKFKRMMEALKAIEPSYAEVAQNPAKLAMLRNSLTQIVNAMAARIAPVTSRFDPVGFTDYYDIYDERIKLGANGARPESAIYEHKFNFHYGFDEAFRMKFFELLDADLKRVNVLPVKV